MILIALRLLLPPLPFPPQATHYGQVFWTDQGNNAIPADIVKRFANKTMAIMGYEQDQVMVTPTGKPGVNPAEDVSVPINWAYNHHYMAWMTGAHSELRKVPTAGEEDVYANGAHGRKMVNKAFDLPSAQLRADPSIPTSQMFSEGNGGESRKSFHGYPGGYAQLIESPETWHITQVNLHTAHCTLHTAHCTAHSAHCTLHSAHQPNHPNLALNKAPVCVHVSVCVAGVCGCVGVRVCFIIIFLGGTLFFPRQHLPRQTPPMLADACPPLMTFDHVQPDADRYPES